MLRLRRHSSGARDGWLRWLPSELILIPTFVLLAPSAYAIYLIAHRRLALGVLLIVAWAVLFGAASVWLHRRGYLHIAAAVACAVGVIGASALVALSA